MASKSPLELYESALAKQRQAGDATPRKRAARQLRPAEVDHLVERYAETPNLNTLAGEFGVSRQSLAVHLNARGIDTTRTITEAQATRAAELYEQGLSAAAVGKEIGYSAQAVITALRRRGVQIRPRPGW